MLAQNAVESALLPRTAVCEWLLVACRHRGLPFASNPPITPLTRQTQQTTSGPSLLHPVTVLSLQRYTLSTTANMDAGPHGSPGHALYQKPDELFQPPCCPSFVTVSTCPMQSLCGSLHIPLHLTDHTRTYYQTLTNKPQHGMPSRLVSGYPSCKR